MNISSFFSDLAAAGKKAEDFLTNVVKGAVTLQKIWASLSGPTLAAAQAVFYDVTKTVIAAQAAVAAGTSGNIANTIILSETTLGLVKQVVTDAVAGEKILVADFKALGIKL